MGGRRTPTPQEMFVPQYELLGEVGLIVKPKNEMP